MRRLLFALLAMSVSGQPAATSSFSDWTRFRGPNGSGISASTDIPVEFSAERNLRWRLALPPGHSSPIVWNDRIYLTAVRGEALLTMAIDREAGTIIWESTAPATARPPVDKRNNPASPSPAVDDEGAYVFFQDFGLIAYDTAGKERWRMPLGPFDNIYGMGASPVLVDNLLVLPIDQSTDSYLLAVDKRTGREVWRTPRPEAKSGHATPILWFDPAGRPQVLLPGSFLLTGYDARTGEKLWWVRGLSFEIKSTPVISDGVLFINGYGAPENDPGNKINVPPPDEVWPTADADKDGLITKGEFPKYSAGFWFTVADLDNSGGLTKEEWEYYRAALDSENGLLAIRLGGSGDVTEQAVLWRYHRSIPQLPSPLVYEGVLWMVNDGGIVTTINPKTGDLIKQGRLMGALGAYYSSPVAADGHVFFISQRGAVSVMPPTGDLTPIHVNDLAEDVYATPAFADGRIYVRTVEALYAFGAAASTGRPGVN